MALVNELRAQELRTHLRTLDPIDLQALFKTVGADAAGIAILPRDREGQALHGWLKLNWTIALIAIGTTLVIWGLSGWRPTGQSVFQQGGLEKTDRQTIIAGAVLIAIGLVGRSHKTAD
ncbi:MAG: hypothetical protein Q7R30_25310 [Acidobacteriota bacterium]|nr:hypothetical protein [Acidobacteriota bacterium]